MAETWLHELDLARTAARSAGTGLAEARQHAPNVLSTTKKDIKLQADRDAEAVIIDHLNQGSSYPVLAEESGESGAIGSDPYWVVDPLDGTMNFSRGIPLCCVSIALMEVNQPRLGVIYDFNRDELFSAIPGEGASLDDRPIRVSEVSDAGQAILATGFPTHRDYGAEAIGGFVNQVQRFKKIRFFGTAALSLAYVACGRVDAYVEEDIMLWDVAAGMALVEAAGGHIKIEESGRMKWARHVRCSSSADLWTEVDGEMG